MENENVIIMDLYLKDKVIIVTGGASEIGESIVRKLAIEGAIACIIDSNEKTTLEVVNKIEDEGQKVSYVLADLTQGDSLKKAIDQIVLEFGRIDGLVNNASLNDGVGLEQGSYQMFIESLDKNIRHYYTMGLFALPYLKASNGRIVNICLNVAGASQGGTSGYAAANGAGIGLTSDFVAEFLPFGIRVYAVVAAECRLPQYGWLNQKQHPEEILKKNTSRILLDERMMTVKKIAEMTIFLLSQKSNIVSGQNVFVDASYVHLDKALFYEKKNNIFDIS